MALDFNNADLDGADLSGANLWVSNLGGAESIDNAVFGGANMGYAKMTDVYNGTFVAAEMGGTNWLSAKIYDSAFNYAKLNGAFMAHATIKNANFTHASFGHADMVHTNIRNTDMKYVNLVGADVRFANVYHVDMRGSDMVGIEFSGAYIGTDTYKVDISYSTVSKCNLNPWCGKNPHDDTEKWKVIDHELSGMQPNNQFIWAATCMSPGLLDIVVAGKLSAASKAASTPKRVVDILDAVDNLKFVKNPVLQTATDKAYDGIKSVNKAIRDNPSRFKGIPEAHFDDPYVKAAMSTAISHTAQEVARLTTTDRFMLNLATIPGELSEKALKGME